MHEIAIHSSRKWGNPPTPSFFVYHERYYSIPLSDTRICVACAFLFPLRASVNANDDQRRRTPTAADLKSDYGICALARQVSENMRARRVYDARAHFCARAEKRIPAEAGSPDWANTAELHRRVHRPSAPSN